MYSKFKNTFVEYTKLKINHHSVKKKEEATKVDKMTTQASTSGANDVKVETSQSATSDVTDIPDITTLRRLQAPIRCLRYLTFFSSSLTVAENKIECLSFGKPSLMFAGKARGRSHKTILE